MVWQQYRINTPERLVSVTASYLGTTGFKTQCGEQLIEVFLGFSQCLQENAKGLTNSKEQSPSWEANSSSATPVIPHILWSPKLHFPVHKSLPFVPIMSQMNPVHSLPSYFFNIHFNTSISLPSMPWSSKWSPSGFPSKTLYAFLFFLQATCSVHLILLDLVTWVIFGDKQKSWRS